MLKENHFENIKNSKTLNSASNLISFANSKTGISLPRNFQFLQDQNENSVLAFFQQGTINFLSFENSIENNIENNIENEKFEFINSSPFSIINSSHLNNGRSLSKEEKLRLERARNSFTSITSFIGCPLNPNTLIIPCVGSLFLITLNHLTQLPFQKQSQQIHSFSPSSIQVHVQELFHSKLEDPPAIDPKWSPDGNFVAFVKQNDIHLARVPKIQFDPILNEVFRLTYASNENKMAGVAEFIIQEEFDRFTGYWWAPKSVQINGENIWRIVYCEVDESKVMKYKIPQAESPEFGKVDTYHYPATGEQNAITDICMIEFPESNPKLAIVKRLTPSIKTRFPSFEYLLSANWMNDANKVLLQFIDRKQQNLIICTINVEEFQNTLNQNVENIQIGVNVLVEQSNPNWINKIKIIHELNDGSIIYISEESGFDHLYILEKDINSPNSFKKRSITSGNWQVVNNSISIDQNRKLIYFISTKDSTLQQHIYVCSYNSNSSTTNCKRLSELGFFWSLLTVDPTCTFFVAKYSNSKQAPIINLYQIINNNKHEFVLDDLKFVVRTTIAAPKIDLTSYVSFPEFFTVKSQTGEILNGCYFKPVNYDPNVKYPAFVYVYGGPHVQLVKDYFELTNIYTKLSITYPLLGIVGIIVDNVGSIGRGFQFESHIYKNMGNLEVLDQCTALDYLTDKGIIDPERVAISGWSYGGYMSLMCLAKARKYFKLAIAGAPVTDWRCYDTGYTERYMNLPKDNKQGYDESSVLNFVPYFPEEENRLMLIHGLIDENVHWCNTTLLIDALTKYGKPYNLIVLPQERHGCGDPETKIYLDSRILCFVVRNI
eukprot:TRINITY_DN1081_c0_g1_i9.p1 TRINITY_DN1081_c0_g1~~TRINITY_DN1081_c0_g1_i9.p1  ORF type:complete len:831 (+),score=340.76 TRINITY_DN1081_c0_g1_i9:147-2639(+)